MAVAVVFLAVGVVDRVARVQLLLAVASVEQTLGRVTFLVAMTVVEMVPTVDWGGAISPWIDT